MTAVQVEFDDLVSGSEIARRLEVTKQRFYVLARSPGFPEPIGEIGRAKVWVWPEVERWAARRQRREGGALYGS